MLIESALGIIALISVGVIWTQWKQGKFGSPSAAFGAGIATLFGKEGSGIYNTINALLTLAVSVSASFSLKTENFLGKTQRESAKFLQIRSSEQSQWL